MKLNAYLLAVAAGVLSVVLYSALGGLFAHVPMLQLAPRYQLPDGSVYFGEMLDGRFHGAGTLKWPSGDEYQGEFRRGMQWGKGRLYVHGGSLYEGDFESGMMHGQGTFTDTDGTVYDGDFHRDSFTGEGSIVSDRDGYRYRGGVRDWRFDGKGRYANENGVFEGTFVDGDFTGPGSYTKTDQGVFTGVFTEWVLNGKGTYVGSDGTRYEGEFRRTSYHGEGKLVFANGDIHEGEFQHGYPNGSGARTYAKPRRGIKEQSGMWEYGQFLDPERKERRRRTSEKAEELLYVENDRLTLALDRIESGINRRSDVFFIGVGGDGSQNVFKSEIELVEKKLDGILHFSGRSVRLVNTYHQDTSQPLATRTSLRRALLRVAENMEKDRDVLLLHLSSHGSKDFVLSLDQPGIRLPDLSATELKQMLDESGIKWKIIVVSACYSGGFIPVIADDSSLVITASDRKSMSFGCSDDSDITWFTKAFVQDAWEAGISIERAFAVAKASIEERERKEGIKKHSNPQISVGKSMRARLAGFFPIAEEEQPPGANQ